VHTFTSLGVIFGFLALQSTINHDIKTAFLWLGIALVVDGVDGSMARKVNVEKNTPNIDGSVLDNIIDYFTYVIVPAFMILEFNMVPDQWLYPSIFIILLTSCYTFSNKELKTEDYYFQGFPAAWNVVVLYIFILEMNQIVSLSFILFSAICTFIPIKTLHPLRVSKNKTMNLICTFLWVISIGFLIYQDNDKFVFELIFILTSLWFTLITLIRSLRKK